MHQGKFYIYWMLIAITLCSSASFVTAQTNDYWVPNYAPLDDRGRMKRLDEIEPRTTIDRIPTNITQSGAYYFIKNLKADTNVVDGIVIEADDVTIDLNGFVLTGTTNGRYGICTVSSSNRNTIIKNGVVLGWGQAGLLLFSGLNCRLINITALGNGSGPANAGISVASDWDVENCTSSLNNNKGFNIGGNSTARNCKARNNKGSGFMIGNSARVENSTAYENWNHGFKCGMVSMILNCSATYNTNNGINVGIYSLASGNISANNGQDGIVAETGSRVERNISAQNFGRGINAGAYSRVLDNQVVGNFGGGILGHTDCRVDANHVFGGTYGLKAAASDDGGGSKGCIFVGNTIAGSTTNFILQTDANFGQMIDSGNIGISTNFNIMNPFANFILNY
jgi:hypothetical protein